MNPEYDELSPEDVGYVREEDALDAEMIKDYLLGAIESIYVTGDVEELERMIEELAHQVDIRYQTKELKIKTMENKMTNEVKATESSADKMLTDIQNTHKVCEALIRTPHYKRMGAEGIFAIVEKAKSVGISPMSALNGGMYFVQGKVEMSASMMNKLIRQAGHSITKDKKSDDKICILHGKRADNGDTWMESFSIEDAKLAGIYRNQWLKYPKDMLFARALSRLARQLYPDILDGCYIEGEISESVTSTTPVIEIEENDNKPITDEQYQELERLLEDNFELRQNFLSFLKDRWGVLLLQDTPVAIYDQFMIRAKKEFEAQNVEANDG